MFKIHGENMSGDFNVVEMFNSLDEETRKFLISQMEKATDVREFTRAIMVGDCPKCGSAKTVDGDDLPGGNICVGTCLSCGYSWCLECGCSTDVACNCFEEIV